MYDEFDHSRVRKSPLMISILTTLVLALVGSYFYITGFAYADPWHWGYFGVFVLSLAGVFFSLKSGRKDGAALFILLCVVSTAGAVQKFNWNRDYLVSKNGPNRFIFEDYIERYPYWEEYLLAKYLKKPDWIRFARDCATPALRDRAVATQCRTTGGISGAYSIDTKREMDRMLKRMQTTARRVQEGKIKKSDVLERCIEKKECAPIPLLPRGVNAEEVDPASHDYLAVRRPFWQLVKQDTLTADICDTMLLCRALTKTGAFKFN